MDIFPTGLNHIIISTVCGDFHFIEKGKDREIEIVFYDHFKMRVKGQHKGTPTVVLDSDEYPTKLVVKETEHPWVR